MSKIGGAKMKKWTALAGAAVFIFCLAAPVIAAGHEDDLAVIKRAIRGGRSCESEKSVKWFNILITDNTSRRDVVRINLPIFVDRHWGHGSKDKHRHCENDKVKAAIRELKKMGSLTLLEILGEDAKIKIWLE
jgi:hypothetical protein